MEVCAGGGQSSLGSFARRAQTTERLALPEMSFLFFLLNSAAKWLLKRVSKSSPPKCVSPAVALTSKMPSSMVNKDTSKVPPPRSKIKRSSPHRWNRFFLSKPYAIGCRRGLVDDAQAVQARGRRALLGRLTLRVGRHAGTVTTAFFTSLPRYAPAISFILTKPWKRSLPRRTSASSAVKLDANHRLVRAGPPRR